MKKWDSIIKEARNCHTKEAWENLFQKYERSIIASNSSKPIEDLFKLLRSDPQSLQYKPFIFAILIKGCLSCWNLELGKTICLFAKSINVPDFTIPAAQLFLECGEPHLSRDISQKSLRLSNLDQRQRLQLQVLVCGSYAEEGLVSKASRLMNKLYATIETSNLKLKDEADLKVQLARMHFFLGQYQKASELFRESSFKFLKLEDWESAARALFNTAACAQNAGKRPVEQAYSFVEESRLLAEKHDLKGPLSHCEAFYGLDAYNHGNFSEARDHFRKALSCLPTTDKSYRRLHIISMLTLSYLALGRYKLAEKFGKQTLELATLDHSNRYQSRYKSLEAELIWESGRPIESQILLDQVVHNYKNQGIHTLEDLSSYSRYLLQSAYLSESISQNKITICPNLNKHMFTYLDFLFAKGQSCLSSGDFQSSEKKFFEVFNLAKKNDDRFHKSIGLLGLIQCQLAQESIGSSFLYYLNEFKLNIRKMADTPLRAKHEIIMAAYAYRSGDFKECYRILKSTSKYSKIGFADNFALKCWIATIEGKSYRLIHDWQSKMIARYTRVYFAPSLKVIDKSKYCISNLYEVNLSRFPALAELFDYLIKQLNFSSDLKNVQEFVWKQSTHSQGWQQKIRNSIMRLRTLFPYTVAPLILHKSNIHLFNEAIRIYPTKKGGAERENEIFHLLVESRLTTSQISQRFAISKATTKRILQNLISQNKIETYRDGRHIYYKTV
ncbi:MAG: hypothetical protein AB8G05_01955 [Oligoflexales bacterium]